MCVVWWKCARQAISTSVGLEDAAEFVAGWVSSVDVGIGVWCWCSVVLVGWWCGREVYTCEGRFEEFVSRSSWSEKQVGTYFFRSETNGPDQDFVCKRY
jgi:hypothetical protein